MNATWNPRVAVGLCVAIVAAVFLLAPTASGLEQEDCENNSPLAIGLPSNPGAYPFGVGAQCSLTLTCGSGSLCGVNVNAGTFGLGVVEGGIMVDGQVQAVCGPAVGSCSTTAETLGSDFAPHVITCYARGVLALDVDVSCSALRP